MKPRPPPDGVTLTQTLDREEITLAPPPTEAPLLGGILHIGGMGVVAAIAWSLFVRREAVFSIAEFTLKLLQEQVPYLDGIAAALLREPILIWTILGLMLLNLVGQGFRAARQGGRELAALLKDRLHPPRPITIDLSAHRVAIDGQTTLLHEVEEVSQVAGLEAVLARQPEATDRWVRDRLAQAIADRPPGEPGEVPDDLRRMRRSGQAAQAR